MYCFNMYSTPTAAMYIIIKPVITTLLYIFKGVKYKCVFFKRISGEIFQCCKLYTNDDCLPLT